MAAQSTETHQLLYPTVGHFDDLFSEALPCVDDAYPHGWSKPWVTESIDQDTGEHTLGHAQIGPYCHVADGKPLWVYTRDHFVYTIKAKLPSSLNEVIFFDIIRRDVDAVVVVRYNIAKLQRVVAQISWESVPFQEVRVV